jgi:hypothetical protein
MWLRKLNLRRLNQYLRSLHRLQRHRLNHLQPNRPRQQFDLWR